MGRTYTRTDLIGRKLESGSYRINPAVLVHLAKQAAQNYGPAAVNAAVAYYNRPRSSGGYGNSSLGGAASRLRSRTFGRRRGGRTITTTTQKDHARVPVRRRGNRRVRRRLRRARRFANLASSLNIGTCTYFVTGNQNCYAHFSTTAAQIWGFTTLASNSRLVALRNRALYQTIAATTTSNISEPTDKLAVVPVYVKHLHYRFQVTLLSTFRWSRYNAWIRDLNADHLEENTQETVYPTPCTIDVYKWVCRKSLPASEAAGMENFIFVSGVQAAQLAKLCKGDSEGTITGDPNVSFQTTTSVTPFDYADFTKYCKIVSKEKFNVLPGQSFTLEGSRKFGRKFYENPDISYSCRKGWSFGYIFCCYSDTEEFARSYIEAGDNCFQGQFVVTQDERWTYKPVSTTTYKLIN